MPKKSEGKAPRDVGRDELVGVETADVQFRTDYNEARREADKQGLPIAIYCTTDKCPWSLLLERETFSDPVVAKCLNQRFMPLKVHAVQNPRLIS